MNSAGRRRAAGPFVALGLLALLAGCERLRLPLLQPLPPAGTAAVAAPRLDGRVGTPNATPPAEIAFAPPHGPGPLASPLAGGAAQNAYSLEFADTDIREVVSQILGSMLGINYSIDPAVHGSVTLHTVRPLSRGELLPTLQTLLASTGAALVKSEGLYRVVPAAAVGSAGSLVLPLRYVSAEELVKVLQPLVGQGVKLAAETGQNALLVSGDASQTGAITELVASFDVDALAGQSYALLPVTAGTARDFADALQEAFRGHGALTGLVRVVPLVRLNAVLVVSSQSRYIEAARQVYAMVDRERRQTIRSWHVHYLQNSHADAIAYTLQMAFTPNNVTAVPPTSRVGNQTAAGLTSSLGGGATGGVLGGGGLAGGSTGIGTTGTAAGLAGNTGTGTGQAGGGLAGSNVGAAGTAQTQRQAASMQGASANPLLGGLDQSAGEESGETMRILPDAQNNAVLIYATPQEEDTVVAMLRKIDILPLQVRIDAVIAEVTLTDTLQYGTQFFFKSGGINGILNNATGAVGSPVSTVLDTTFPGFVLGGTGQGGAPLALSALQAVTTVNVLSSPQLVVVDNEPARLQVGSLVPYLTASATSTLTANSAIVNSVGYQPTGVILQVTPRVNSGGLVTLDLSQEVSDVDTTSPNSSGINSPTFTERSVTSQVVIEDGQTVGIAGLIRDNNSRGNSGIPWLKDIPLLGALAGTQDNQRTRTELLILITPHVMRDAHDARALTEDMREGLRNAAALAEDRKPPVLSGSPDPNERLRARARARLDGEPAP
jgi:general secretion pathway protein D